MSISLYNAKGHKLLDINEYNSDFWNFIACDEENDEELIKIEHWGVMRNLSKINMAYKPNTSYITVKELYNIHTDDLPVNKRTEFYDYIMYLIDEISNNNQLTMSNIIVFSKT